ncbi:DUF1707 domain-containing protein [Actinokineospora bangkokensis]|uniref:Uncharacterized protein n=1 Tax=Actinokineospora bangkokensis TaxID=1193682 RepID=A0A1Q9LIA8_9PSEU|nr:DUF1707 domain-containing protein [Actinokineospora bangkokensis]OLR91768.1 hypothetical protein BJP25_24900 [Actinokineospora bangkokensis]
MTAPREPGDPDLVRIGTLEREDAIRVLGEHFAAGRLQVDEYDERARVAAAAVNRAELRALFTDLPAPYPPFLAPPVWSAAAMPPPPRVLPGPPVAGPYPVAPPPGVLPVYPGTSRYEVGMSDKSRVTAGVLQILFPTLGIGRFYTGDTGIAIAQLLTCGGFGIWGLVDGIILLANGGTDGHGRRLRD